MLQVFIHPLENLLFAQKLTPFWLHDFCKRGRHDEIFLYSFFYLFNEAF